MKSQDASYLALKAQTEMKVRFRSCSGSDADVVICTSTTSEAVCTRLAYSIVCSEIWTLL